MTNKSRTARQIALQKQFQLSGLSIGQLAKRADMTATYARMIVAGEWPRYKLEAVARVEAVIRRAIVKQKPKTPKTERTHTSEI